MVTNTGNTVRERVGAIIQDDLEDIDIDATFEIIRFGEIVAQLTATYDWEAIIIGFGGSMTLTPESPCGTAAQTCTYGTPTSRQRPGKPSLMTST